jgi:hypothetical protein
MALTILLTIPTMAPGEQGAFFGAQTSKGVAALRMHRSNN